MVTNSKSRFMSVLLHAKDSLQGISTSSVASPRALAELALRGLLSEMRVAALSIDRRLGPRVDELEWAVAAGGKRLRHHASDRVTKRSRRFCSDISVPLAIPSPEGWQATRSVSFV